MFPVAPELVEALADLGEFDEALRGDRAPATAERGAAASVGTRYGPPLRRGRAARRPARTTSTRRSHSPQRQTDYERLGLRFDHARSLLSLGRAQRRMKKWGPARESLQGAVAAFEELGSAGWARRARSELARVGGRRPRRRAVS